MFEWTPRCRMNLFKRKWYRNQKWADAQVRATRHPSIIMLWFVLTWRWQRCSFSFWTNPCTPGEGLMGEDVGPQKEGKCTQSGEPKTDYIQNDKPRTKGVALYHMWHMWQMWHFAHVRHVTFFTCDRCDIFHMWHIWHLVQDLHRHVWLEGWLKLQITGTGATGPPSEETSRIKNPRRFSIKLSQAQNSQRSWWHLKNRMLTKKVKNVSWRDWTLSGPWLLGLEREEEMMIDARFDLLYLGNNFCTWATTSSLFWEYNWDSMFAFNRSWKLNWDWIFDGQVCLQSMFKCSITFAFLLVTVVVQQSIGHL